MVPPVFLGPPRRDPGEMVTVCLGETSLAGLGTPPIGRCDTG
jgi:hypothetical protein